MLITLSNSTICDWQCMECKLPEVLGAAVERAPKLYS